MIRSYMIQILPPDRLFDPKLFVQDGGIRMKNRETHELKTNQIVQY